MRAVYSQFLAETLCIGAAEEAIGHTRDIVAYDTMYRVPAVPVNEVMRVVEKKLK